MSWLGDLVILMEDASVGTLNSTLFTGTKQTEQFHPSGVLTIIETPGTGPERTQNSVIRPAYTRPAAQFKAKAATTARARAIAQAAYDAVVGIRNVYIFPTGFVESGTWYREILPLQDPFDSGVDDKGHPTYTFNVIAIKRPSRS